MNLTKRSFLKSLAALGGTSLTPWLHSQERRGEYNWAGNVRYGTDKLTSIESTEQLQETVSKLPSLKSLGSRHCFSRIADSAHQLLSLRSMNRILEVHDAGKTVVVEGGIRYGDLGPHLHKKGFALHNLASLPHITVAGAMATATHGSGNENGNLATTVSAFEFVAADGTLHRLSRDENADTFPGAVVHLGALGIITKVWLDIQPAFLVREYAYRQLPLANLYENLPAIMASAYSVSVFTKWDTASLRLKVRDDVDFNPPAELSGAQLVKNEKRNQPAPWFERLPHFRMDSLPERGNELQSEYFVKMEHAAGALKAIASLGDRIRPILRASELRTVAADQLWMSPCYQQPSLAIHFTWKADGKGVRECLPVIEGQLAPYGARPHWGKLFAMDYQMLQSRYEKLEDFHKLVRTYDPEGKFHNAFTRKHLSLG